MAKEEKIVTYPPLSNSVSMLRTAISESRVDEIIEQMEIKVDVKPYVRTKDFKIKLRASNKTFESWFGKVPSFSDEENSFENEYFAKLALIDRVGYTLENEQNYNRAVKDGLDKAGEVIEYSKSTTDNIYGKEGFPIKTRPRAAWSFKKLISYDGVKNEEKINPESTKEYYLAQIKEDMKRAKELKNDKPVAKKRKM